MARPYRPASPRRTRLAVQPLEDRSVPAGWALDIGGTGSAASSSGGLVLDPGNPDPAAHRPASAYLIGMFSGTADFNGAAPGGQLTAAGTTTNSFVARYTPGGELLGTPLQLSATGQFLARGAAVDPDGNLYVVGRFAGDTTLAGRAFTARGDGDVFVAKVLPDGTMAWAHSLGGADGDYGYGIAADATGAYVTGAVSPTVYLDGTTPVPGLAAVAGAGDAFVAKFDPSGALAYATRAGGGGGDVGFAVAVDAAGRAYVTGDVSGAATFGDTVSVSAQGFKDAFVAQLDAQGRFTWARRMGGTTDTNSDSGYGDGGCAVAVAGDWVYVGGRFQGPGSFGDPADPLDAGATTLVGHGGDDGFVAALDTAGHVQWARSVGGYGNDAAWGLAADGAGGVYASGFIVGPPADFDPGTGSAFLPGAARDGFVWRLDPAGAFGGAWRTRGAGVEAGLSVAADAGGAVYTAGHFQGDAGFDTGVGTTVAVANADEMRAFLTKIVPATGTVLGQVFVDADGDGARDPDEAGMTGRPVSLYDAAGTLVASTTTGSSGAYAFRHLPEGTYTVAHTPAAGWSQTAAPGAVTVGPGAFATGRDFGNASPAATRSFASTRAVGIRDWTATDYAIKVTNASTVYDLAVKLDVSHPNLAELSARLIAPDGTTSIDLFARGGAAGTRLPGTTFTDDATRFLAGGVVPDGGTYLPVRSRFAVLEGTALNGTWTLRITDHVRKNTGTLHGWSLVVTGSDLGSPLVAAGGAADGPAARPLTTGALRPIVAEAVRRWTATGLTAAERALLRHVRFEVADLAGATLGLASGNVVTLDRTAAGHGWFVDKTPRSDAEFRRAGDQGEQGKVDLLTAVMHELGHVLGREHAAGGVMGEELTAGTRLSPEPAHQDGPPAATAGLPAARQARVGGWFLSRSYRM